jgi:biopolymer transport protein TolR
MIDILLVLLLIFMIITPTKSHGLEARVPSPAGQSDSADSRDIVVRIAGDGALTINAEQVAWPELSKRFTEIFARRAEKILFLAAEPSTEFSDVAQVIDTAKGVGVSHVAFMPRGN